MPASAAQEPSHQLFRKRGSIAPRAFRPSGLQQMRENKGEVTTTRLFRNPWKKSIYFFGPGGNLIGTPNPKFNQSIPLNSLDQELSGSSVFSIFFWGLWEPRHCEFGFPNGACDQSACNFVELKGTHGRGPLNFGSWGGLGSLREA